MTTLELCKKTRAARASLASADRAAKDALLLSMADSLLAAAPEILEANAQDMAAARGHITDVMLDRRYLDEKRLAAMAGVPVVPCAAHALPMPRIGTWDRMLIPLPFARGVAVAGRPILPDGGMAAFHAAVLQDALDMAADRAAEAVCA